MILAAIIAAFVMGMPGNIEKTKTVGLTAQKMNGKIVIMNAGGANAGELTGFTATTTPLMTGCSANYNSSESTCEINGNPVPVGAQMSLLGSYDSQTHVTVIGDFTGQKQVLLDTYL